MCSPCKPVPLSVWLLWYVSDPNLTVESFDPLSRTLSSKGSRNSPLHRGGCGTKVRRSWSWHSVMQDKSGDSDTMKRCRRDRLFVSESSSGEEVCVWVVWSRKGTRKHRAGSSCWWIWCFDGRHWPGGIRFLGYDIDELGVDPLHLIHVGKNDFRHRGTVRHGGTPSVAEDVPCDRFE